MVDNSVFGFFDLALTPILEGLSLRRKRRASGSNILLIGAYCFLMTPFLTIIAQGWPSRFDLLEGHLRPLGAQLAELVPLVWLHWEPWKPYNWL